MRFQITNIVIILYHLQEQNTLSIKISGSIIQKKRSNKQFVKYSFNIKIQIEKRKYYLNVTCDSMITSFRCLNTLKKNSQSIEKKIYVITDEIFQFYRGLGRYILSIGTYRGSFYQLNPSSYSLRYQGSNAAWG